LLKIAIAVSQATVAKYMVRHRKPPSQTWPTFLKNHAKDLVSADFFVVPTITFQLLFVFVILDHDRRRPIHFAVTSNPTAEWTARQLLEAFRWDNAPRYLLRDRDNTYGEKFCETAKMDGYSGSPSCVAITMAKRLRGALDRVHSTGVRWMNHSSSHAQSCLIDKDFPALG
jgi:hypothetical protein